MANFLIRLAIIVIKWIKFSMSMKSLFLPHFKPIWRSILVFFSVISSSPVLFFLVQSSRTKKPSDSSDKANSTRVSSLLILSYQERSQISTGVFISVLHHPLLESDGPLFESFENCTKFQPVSFREFEFEILNSICFPPNQLLSYSI